MHRLARDAMNTMTFPFCVSSNEPAIHNRGHTPVLVFLFAFWMLCAVLPANVSAFSFGDIDIQSNFGERFNAELDLILEGEGKVDVQIGSEEDYRRLELNRPRIIDNLVIEKTVQLQGGRKVIRVVSKRPLFYPSFNLVMRGTHDGGTVIENYLVTVDFRQSLALNVKGRKKSQSAPPTSEPVDLLQGGEAGSDSLAAASGKKEAESEAADSQASAGDPDATDAPASPPVSAAASQSKPPSPLMGKREPDSPIRSARWARKRVAPEPPPFEPEESEPQDAAPVEVAENVQSEPPEEETPEPTEPSLPPASVEAEAGSVSTRGDDAAMAGGLGSAHYGPLQRGESLFSISKNLGVARADANRFVVAVWLDNPDSFVFGNMNGLRQGSRLNLEKLEQRLAEVDRDEARNLIESQWQEWKVIRQRFSTPLGADDDVDTTSQENRMPSENARDKLQIFEMLKEWKQTWEAGDLDGHMGRFSERALLASAGGGIHALKRRMFKRHQDVRIRAHRAILVQKAGDPIVSFDQSFSSKKMESFGRKDIGIVWEDAEWKIRNERFRVKEYQEKAAFVPFAQMSATPASLDAPLEEAEEASEAIFARERPLESAYVIHASSHMDYRMATQAINELRNKGFNAYSTPVYISRKRKIFRVYVGRFFDEALAKDVARELKRLPIARFAVPVRYPYTLMAGEYDAEEQAQEKIDALRSLGLSPFLFTTSDEDFSRTRFRVLLGAFAKEKDAARLSRDLKANEIEFSLIAP